MYLTNETRLRRLIALRDEGFPLAEQKEREGALNFNIFLNGCETEGCLLGWWATTDYARKEGWTSNGFFPMWERLEANDAANAYFGEGAYRKLFMAGYKNQSPADCLAERRAILDEMIAEHLEVAK